MKLVLDHFSKTTELPVEIDEIVNFLIASGIQDEVFLFPVEADPTKLRGAIRQFRYHKLPYGDPISVTHIVYTTLVPLEWQRIICAKELVHVFDREVEKTETSEEVAQLLDKLVGPLSTEDYGFADLQAAVDRLALYQCLPLLLPTAALQEAKEAISRGHKTVEDVAKAACMPLFFVDLMLSSDWEKLNGILGDK